MSTTALSGTPFGNRVDIFDGTLSLVGTAGVQALTIGTVTYGAGSSIQLAKNAATSTKLTATALTRVNQGAIVIVPSVLANLGGTEQFATGSTFTNTNGMLTLPTIVVRNPSTFELDFVQNSGATGFTLRAANGGDGSTVFATTAAGNAIVPASAVADSSQVAPQTVNAVRTGASITSPGQVLTIASGGLILNPNTASGNAGVTISTDLVFGASAAAPGEALVYTAASSTAHTLSGSFTATNFTKSGLGDLLISGTGNVMAPTSTALRTIQINDGSVQFAGQGSLPSGGLINIAPMDGAEFDINGQNLTIAALGGQTTATAATGRIINTGAAATLTIATQTGVTSNSNGLITGNIALVKSGIGTAILGYNNDYNGGTTINAGNITSASGLYTPLGSLQIGSFNSLGTGPVNLAGGILDIRNTIAPNEVQDNIDVITIGPGNGYDLTINALNNFGSANTTSQIATNSTTGFQAVNSLTINAPVLTFGGGSTNGLLVRNDTTFAGDTVLNVAQQAVLGGTINASGKTITKIGASALYLTNTGTGSGSNPSAPNAVGAWNVMQGTLEVRRSQGGSNQLGTGATVTLNGATINFRTDNDNLSDPSTVSVFAGNNFVNGSLATMSSGNFISSINTVIDVRSGNAANNNTVQIGSIAFGGPLGTNFLSLNGANNFSLEIAGGMTMTNDAYLSLNFTSTTLSGTVSGNGTLFKQGGANLEINTTANTATGGTVLAAGNTYFANFRGNTRELNTTSTLAAGNVTIQPGAILRFTGIGNVNGGQLVDVRSNLNTYGVIGIGDNTALADYHLRVPQAGGAFDGNMQRALNTGAGVLAINSTYSQTIDLGKIGDGTWFLGSTTNGSFLEGSYNAASLGAGKSYNFGAGSGNNTDSVVRLAGGGAIIYIGSDFTNNALSDVTFGASTKTSLVTGAPLTNSGSVTVGNGAGTAIIIGNQTYTGTTLVNRGSVLEIRGTMTSPSYETFGALAVGGAGGRFFNGATAIQPTIRQGGEIQLRNDFDLLANGISAQGRYGDATPVVLNSGILRLVGSNAADIREVVGAVSIDGGSLIIPNRSFTGRITELNMASLTRLNQGQVSIHPQNAGQLGSDERVTVAGANLAAQLANISGATLANGMMTPWIWNQTDVQFVTYSDFGFVNAGFDRAIGGALVTNPLLANERLLVNAAATIADGVTVSTWGVRADANISGTNAGILSIGSGGLISNVANTITTAITTTGELYIGNQVGNMIIGTLANNVADSVATGTGKITATAISKTGDGLLFLDSDHTSFTGPIALNRGQLFIRDSDTTAGTSNNGGNGSVITVNGYAATLGFRGDVTNEIFNNSIVLAAGNALVTVNVDRAASTTLTGAKMQVAGTLTFGGAPGDQGQNFSLTSGNTYQLQINGTTDLGPVGNAVFRLDNTLTLGGVTSNQALTGSATIIKQAAGQLNLGLDAAVYTTTSDNTGGLIIQGGTVQVGGNSTSLGTSSGNVLFSQLGSGDITILGGALSLRVDGDATGTNRTYLFADVPNLNIVGSTTITSNRSSAIGASNKTLAFNTLNIGGQTLTVNQGNNYSTRFNAVNLSGTPTFTGNFGTVLSGVSDGGSNLYIVKNGGNEIWFDDRLAGSAAPNAVNTFTGGIYINQGLMRFGNLGGASTLATAGTSQIQINPEGAIRLEAGTNIDTGSGQSVLAMGSVARFATVRILAANTPAQLAALINPASTNSTLRIEATYANPLSLAAGSIGDGSLYLGSQGTIAYTANALGAGNGNTYRLGANDSATNRLDLSPVVGTANVLTGANRLLVGALAVNGQGTVLLNNDNTYTGGTTVSRGSSLFIRSGVTLGDTPLGSGTVDVFGLLGAVSVNGQFRNALNTPGDLLGRTTPTPTSSTPARR